jgi:23S rRNA pseudouridine2457 synthase
LCREIYFPVLTNPSIYKVSLLRDFCFCMNHYFIIYKPYLVLSQFSAVEEKQTLADFFDVPKDVYPVGRLDHDSEGLLLLTNDKEVNHRLLDPKFAHEQRILGAGRWCDRYKGSTTITERCYH